MHSNDRFEIIIPVRNLLAADKSLRFQCNMFRYPGSTFYSLQRFALFIHSGAKLTEVIPHDSAFLVSSGWPNKKNSLDLLKVKHKDCFQKGQCGQLFLSTASASSM